MFRVSLGLVTVCVALLSAELSRTRHCLSVGGWMGGWVDGWMRAAEGEEGGDEREGKS